MRGADRLHVRRPRHFGRSAQQMLSPMFLSGSSLPPAQGKTGATRKCAVRQQERKSSAALRSLACFARRHLPPQECSPGHKGRSYSSGPPWRRAGNSRALHGSLGTGYPCAQRHLLPVSRELLRSWRSLRSLRTAKSSRRLESVSPKLGGYHPDCGVCRPAWQGSRLARRVRRPVGREYWLA